MAGAIITQNRLKELLFYCPDAGVFSWVAPTSRRVAKGDVAGAKDHYGYVVIRLDRILYKAHRLAWLYEYGEMPDGGLDHINRIKSDNRIANLRIANQSENMQNLEGMRGIRWDFGRKKWRVQIKTNYKNKFIGRFDALADAIKAREQAKKEMHTFVKAQA